jgi:hypothetical protein
MSPIRYRDELERTLINHCSPVLFGVKPSALFTVKTGECCACLLESLHRIDKDVSSLILRKSKNGILVMIYRSNRLNSLMVEPETHRLLHAFGYPAECPALQSHLDLLKMRILERPDFPHEIGLFLGYPADDVMGFIEQKGKNYKYCGLWKVYGSVEKACNLFRHYESCREKSRRFMQLNYFWSQL